MAESLPNTRLNMNVVAKESGELYPEQSQYEEFDDIEVLVELFSDHPEVEGSLEICGPRWRVKEILEELSKDAGAKLASSNQKAAYDSRPIYQETDESLEEVLTDVTKKATGEELNPYQKTLVGVFDEFLKVFK